MRKLFEAFNRSNDRPKEKDPVQGLHPHFGVQHGTWRFNRDFDGLITDRNIALKARFAFNTSADIQETDLLAKIGANMDPSLPYRFIGFAYSSAADRSRLEEYARRYPWAELITDLDHHGVVTDASEHIPLKG